jgi:DNA-binding response OmpR family regulator
VPDKPPTLPTALLPRGILLVEEYGALSVAFASALHKFAPLHEVRVAHSFAEAEVAAAAIQPELFVLDLDPPPLGEIEFFNKLRTQYPNARVMIIAAGTSRELRAARGTAGAIQFIEKPFDLAEFGAAVQAMLGPWAMPPSSSFQGTVRDLHVVDIMQLKCLALSTAAVRLETPEGKSGEIHFHKGQISHASVGELTGVPALEEIVSWSGGKLTETGLPSDAPRSIDVPSSVLLLQVVRKMAEQARKKSLGTSATAGLPAAKNGKKILVVDDTEMLLIFVADVLATADPTFQIITASTGTEGLRLAVKVRPDVVLLDYCLPDINGDEVCRGLLANNITARIPVLMMSGRLTELTKTAEDFDNVVATLPKPFLSGELINAVEKVLAAGLLPKAPRPKAAAPEPPPPPPAPPTSVSAPPPPPAPPSTPLPERAVPPTPVAKTSPNGHGHGSDGRTKPAPPAGAAVAPPAPAAAEPQSAPIAPEPVVPSPPPAPQEIGPIVPVVRQTDVALTLSLQLVSLQLTTLFRVETMKLQSVDPTVAVKMGGGGGLGGVPIETSFQLGAIQLGTAGELETIRLFPTLQSPQLPAGENSFAIGGLSVQLANAHQNVQLIAPANDSMRVRLTAQCELLTVELSRQFEVAAVLLKLRGGKVVISNSAESAGPLFHLQEVELDPAAQLRGVLVRALA